MIRSTFSGFTMAQLALSASQRAIDVAGQNLSNVNTSGYTRQRLDLTSINPIGASFSSSKFDNKVGQGVMMNGITQIRDPYLDIQYRNQIAKAGTADATDQILEKIGNIFDETDSKGIRSAFNDIISQLTNIAQPSEAGEESSDALVRSACTVFLNAIHQNATSIENMIKDVVDELQNSDIKNVNSCIQQILELNTTIKNTQIMGNPALELQDQRNQLLDDLATYLPIEVTYETEGTGSQAVDTLKVTFRDIAGNVHNLISDNKGGEFQLGTAGEGIPVSLKIKDALTADNPSDPTNVNNIDVADLMSNGVLKGKIDMLNKSESFDGTDTKGIGYYSSMFDTFVNTFATLMNGMNATENGTVAHDLFSTSDGSDTFTAGNIKISDEWMNGTVTLTRTQNTGAGDTENSTDYSNILKMIHELSNKDHDFAVFRGTMLSGYDNIQNTQAIERKASSSILSNHISVLNQISDSKDAVSGVNLDEEVMDMMRYQQSYNAASRLMTTLDQLLDKLINETGVVGR
ncbi:flagellar hook-associated protein FlgK [Clostridium sp. C105KSO13]|uniref:flagellar hook-associated protein FlgK n=1 Tax=Clostridium sp. C105KSO13 TaxID=1776045 RepID=UPI000740624A|nr:flagellar hook-associated protein FlgK [Clostridium sp. C105KSO13]CUX49619.1 flagellar hook-associated protein FlgK [Clostridium sp. C105KSO13]